MLLRIRIHQNTGGTQSAFWRVAVGDILKKQVAMNRRFEVRIDIPNSCELIGCRSDGNMAIIVFEDCSGPEIRPIGFCREHSGEVPDAFEDE